MRLATTNTANTNTERQARMNDATTATMTKQQYINEHPRSMLTIALQENDWPDNQPIEIIGGLLAPDNKCSNLYKALTRSILHQHEVGGHRRYGPDGWMIAVA